MNRTIFLLAGPSGAGKTALTNALIHRRSGLNRGVTVTTRERRPEEVDDKDYIFVSQTQFEKMLHSKPQCKREFPSYISSRLAT